MPELSTAYCKIFPPIGIARVGNSPTEHFIGPEAPGVVPEVAGGYYKDRQGRIKRQAARFRVYAFFPDGTVEELTADHPEVQSIEWTVELANRKAQWHVFEGTRKVAKVLAGEGVPFRNAGVPIKDRGLLAIGPDRAVVSGKDSASVAIEGVFGLNRERHQVHLGDASTDEAGRLVVLGGLGRSESVLDTNPLTHYANNDGWFDDTSDGPVTASIKLKDESILPVQGRSWVVCAPPHYSPWTKNVVTLHDVMTEAAVRHNLVWNESELGPKPDDTVSFARDIYPALTAMGGLQWVSRRSQRGHAPGKRGEFPDEKTLRLLASPEEAAKPNSLHKRFFARLRHPVATPPYDDDEPMQRWPVLSRESILARQQATLYYMPPLAGDEGDVAHESPEYWLTLTPRQYAKFARWKDGDFTSDWTGTPALPSFTEIPVRQQPAALTSAALEWTQGGAFFPGIELTSIVRHRSFYGEALRVSDASVAGDLTRWMALPWQADFYECRDHWWPAVRPDDVIPVGDYERIIEEFEEEAANGGLADLLIARKPWARGVGIDVVGRPGFQN